MVKNKGLFYGITINVFLLGITSLLTDLSSEIIVPLLPIVMTSLGASAILIGLLGGLNESVISIMHLASGYIADKTGRRKNIVIFGYSTSALVKLFMAFSTSWLQILILRPLERIGKGVREPPRDAILAETTPKKVHGTVFGIHRALDTAGALIGSILAVVFLGLGFAYNKIFLIAALISFSSIIPLLFVREKRVKPKKISLRIGLKNLPKKLKVFILVSTIFAIANFSYMFFVLRAQEFFSIKEAVLFYVLFNISYEIFAIPSGILADKLGEKKLIIYGYLLFAIVCINFALFSSFEAVFFGFVLYGLSHALIIGNQRALAADLSTKEIGTGIGTFYMFVSLASLPAGIIAGALWQYVSPAATFIFGAVIAITAAIVFAVLKLKK